MKPIFIALLALCLCVNAFTAESPNVILMMADDMGMGDTSAYQDFTQNSDQAQIHTPQMDRLARMGVRFTDAHTPSSRCTPTRYGLLTGRYPWRNRLKYWVLFGVQGDPMIEADRPTLATLFRSQGYATGMVGKWHLGLRYRRPDGSPAAAWDDADLTKPLADGPADHGFDFCRITSRSHGTSGPDAGRKGVRVGKNKRGDRNTSTQAIGPGHIHGRISVSANGKQLHKEGPNAYILHGLGSRHSNSAMEFLKEHLTGKASKKKPFFLYYACNSNHGPYTPDKAIGGKPVRGVSRSVSGEPMKVRYDYIYENDVALGRLLDFLQTTDDPRRPSKKLLGNTIVIFTSDNGAEIKAKTATGPFRSNKGSVYEGGHRVPFIVAWPEGRVGNGNAKTPGKTSAELLGLQDMYSTFSKVLETPLPDLRKGEKGAEDSFNVLPAWRGEKLGHRPMIFNDHKEGKDGAASALRLDNPKVNGQVIRGKWKLFFDASLLRFGKAQHLELYNLASDPREARNRLEEEKLKPLVKHLTEQALLHRNVGGHRATAFASAKRLIFDWRKAHKQPEGIMLTLTTKGGTPIADEQGLGVEGGVSDQVDSGEALLFRFDQDVLVESAAIVAGEGTCGGFYRMGEKAQLAIYCVDADIDSKDQQGILSDLGVLKAGETLLLDSSSHHGAEAPGNWRLRQLIVRPLGY